MMLTGSDIPKRVKTTPQRVKLTTFSTPFGVQECYCTLTSREGSSLQEAIRELSEQYAMVLLENGLDESSIQFTRFFSSDCTNDFEILFTSELYRSVSSGAISYIQQSPLGAGSLAMLVYHIKSDGGSFCHVSGANHSSHTHQKVYTIGKYYSLLWCTNFTDTAGDSAIQTRNIFSNIAKCMRSYKMHLRHNTIRTWIYVRDIDNNYAGMVEQRRKVFDSIGLTSKTRYIASTGIEGKTIDPHCLVVFDSLSVGNLKEEQLIKMEALENLSPTNLYGVTFERGQRVRFGDRSHLYISGTASIDKKGKIIHPGNIRKQLERTIDNIEALLLPHGANLGDMMYLILYLRNPKHYPLITDILGDRIPKHVSLIAVEGAVCRPGWLVEIEGVGIINDKAQYPPFL